MRLARKHPALADVLFRKQFADARIVRTMGRLLVSAPRSARLLAALARPLVVRAIERGWVGGLHAASPAGRPAAFAWASDDETPDGRQTVWYRSWNADP